ncbi:Isonitrile hydratase [bioreactor metagenome]|uniref:Isonitrile hydratase n=1 Tax=bioreactor metagenome TaxID=1076179 RepID=A0A645E1T4_9ZZZZ
MMDLNVILFDDFETLDVFGPVEVIGKLEKYFSVQFFSQEGGLVRSSQNVLVDTRPVTEIKNRDVLLLPGGTGTRKEAKNEAFLKILTNLAEESKFVLTVCTGSGLLATTGVLKGKRATSNKIAFDWAAGQDSDVQWIRKARWVQDGKFYTSSGVSAGMDMALGFVAVLMGTEVAERVAAGIEYIWNRDKDFDPFCQSMD